MYTYPERTRARIVLRRRRRRAEQLKRIIRAFIRSAALSAAEPQRTGMPYFSPPPTTPPTPNDDRFTRPFETRAVPGGRVDANVYCDRGRKWWWRGVVKSPPQTLQQLPPPNIFITRRKINRLNNYTHTCPYGVVHSVGRCPTTVELFKCLSSKT